MKFYTADGVYYLTKQEAEKRAREAAAESYYDVTVERVEIDTTRDNILRMLNVDGGHTVDKGVVYTAKAKLKRGRDDQ
jgi:ribosomal protein L23